MLNSKITKIPCTLRLAGYLYYNYSWSPNRYSVNRNSKRIKTDPSPHILKTSTSSTHQSNLFGKKSLWNTPSDKTLIPHHLTAMNLTGRILCSSQSFLVWSPPEEATKRRHCCGEYCKNDSEKQQLYKYCVQGTRGAELLWSKVFLWPQELCKQSSR